MESGAGHSAGLTWHLPSSKKRENDLTVSKLTYFFVLTKKNDSQSWLTKQILFYTEVPQIIVWINTYQANCEDLKNILERIIAMKYKFEN